MFSHVNQTIVILILFVLFKLNLTKVLSDDNDNSSNNKDTRKQTNAIQTQAFQEFFIEHNVTQTDAIKAYWEIGVKLLDDKPLPPWCKSMPCTDERMRYCLGGKLLDDHCCCDARHGKEELPWISHSCYYGDGCTPSIGSCMVYTEIRQCCCDRALAKRYKKIYSAGSHFTINRMFIASLTSLMWSWNYIWQRQ